MVDAVLKTYERQAAIYDRSNAMMEVVFGKGRALLTSLWGDILEVGVGTGLNLPHYSPDARVIALDWSPRMVELARQRANRLGLTQVKEIRVGDVQDLHWIPPASFDFVTSSCVFCSIPNPVKGLREIGRILRPTGYLVQIEHGLSKISILNDFLKFIDPLMVKMKGAHLTRNHEKNLEQAGFEINFDHELDPAGITRIIISHPSRTNY